MSLPKIKISYQNGLMGAVSSDDDKLFAMVANATAVSTTFVLKTPYPIYRLKNLEDLGVSSTNNPKLYMMVEDFYNEAPEGTKLIVVGYSSETFISGLCDKDTGDLKGLLQTLKGTLHGIFIGKEIEVGTEQTIVTGLDDDIVLALPKAQALAEWSQDNLYAPLFIVIDGYGFTNATDALDLKTLAYNHVAVVVGSRVSGSDRMAVGTVAGRMSQLSVQRNIGRVKNGPLSPSKMYISSKLVENSMDDIETLYDKGYITPRIFVGKSGYYFTDDHTACADTDDYAHICLNRVIGKAARIAYKTMIDEILDDLDVNSDGTLDTAIAKSIQSTVEQAIKSEMTDNGELSPGTNKKGCQCYVDESQNILTTSIIEMTLQIQPKGYARLINIELGFLVTT